MTDESMMIAHNEGPGSGRAPSDAGSSRRNGHDTTDAPSPSKEEVHELHRLVHALNNALTPVLGNAQLLQTMVPRDADLRGEVDDIVEGARRAVALVDRMRRVSGRGGDSDRG